MCLYDYLIEKGIDPETASNNVLLWEWELPATTKEIDQICWEWWNKTWKGVKNEHQRTKNKTN